MKFIDRQIKKCLLFRCRDAVVIMQTLNWTNQCPLFMTVRHIFEISEDDHPSLVTHARDIWWTLDSANAFVSPGVNSLGELVTLARRFAPSDRGPEYFTLFTLSAWMSLPRTPTFASIYSCFEDHKPLVILPGSPLSVSGIRPRIQHRK
jgi:hypothetical protein